MSDTKTKTILIFAETSPIVINKLIEMGYEVITTTDFLEFCRQDISELDFSNTTLSLEETIALARNGLIPFQSEQDKLLEQMKERLDISANKFAITREAIDETSLYLREPVFYSNKDRFHNKRKWRK